MYECYLFKAVAETNSLPHYRRAVAILVPQSRRGLPRAQPPAVKRTRRSGDENGLCPIAYQPISQSQSLAVIFGRRRHVLVAPVTFPFWIILRPLSVLIAIYIFSFCPYHTPFTLYSLSWWWSRSIDGWSELCYNPLFMWCYCDLQWANHTLVFKRLLVTDK